MRSFAAVASLFLFFIAAGTAIECEVCSSRAGTDCSGELVTCVQTVERCQTTITEYSAEGKQSVYNVFKNCSGEEAKNTMYRSATKHAFYQLRIEICQTPGCNKGPLQFPPVNSTLNGVKCPSCAVDGALGCEATEVVECFGELTNCIYLAATFRLPGRCLSIESGIPCKVCIPWLHQCRERKTLPQGSCTKSARRCDTGSQQRRLKMFWQQGCDARIPFALNPGKVVYASPS